MHRSSDCFWSAQSSRGVPRAALASAALLLALLVTPPMAAADPAPPAGRGSYNVLLLFASPRLTPAQVAIDEAFRSTLSSRLAAPVFFYTEYLDLTLFRGDEPRPELRALLKHKYVGVKLDLVAAFASRAVRFAVQNRADLFPGAPVVFGSVVRAALGDHKLDDDVTGIWLNVDFAGTLDAALRLQPDTRRVVVITGTSATDRVWQAAARRQLDVARYSGVAIEYVSDLAVDQVLQRVAALSQGTIVLFGAFTRDSTGQDLLAAEVVRRVAAQSSVPVYGPGETYVGGGIVGGHVVSFTAQGLRAAELASNVLQGDRPRPLDGAASHVAAWLPVAALTARAHPDSVESGCALDSLRLRISSSENRFPLFRDMR